MLAYDADLELFRVQFGLNWAKMAFYVWMSQKNMVVMASQRIIH